MDLRQQPAKMGRRVGVSKAIARRRARDTVAMFDAYIAANGDEKALGRINKDLRAAEE